MGSRRAKRIMRLLALSVFVGGLAAAVFWPLHQPTCTILQEFACPSNEGIRFLIAVGSVVAALILWALGFESRRRFPTN
jgi:hypothetical protein